MVPIPIRPLGLFILQCPNPTIKVEIFQDLACPFSARSWKTLSVENGVFDKVKTDERLKDKVEFIMHSVPQPWHPQSACMHEGLCAVQCAVNDDTNLVQKYLKAAFSSQDAFTDLHTKDLSRRQIHDLCCTMAAEQCDTSKEEVMKYLDFSHLNEGNPNDGLGEVTQRMKFSVKYHRKRGVHVTPTVFVNDVEDSGISSSFTADEWMEKLHSMLR